jgi:integrase
MPLTEMKVKNAKFDETKKVTKIFDEKGMFLQVMKNDSKYFKFQYYYAGKQQLISLGVYPETSLKEARARRDEARKMLDNGINPSSVRKLNKNSLLEDTENNFQSVATEWFVKFQSKWTPQHAKTKWRSLEKDIFPYLGKTPIKNITPQDVLNVLNRIQSRGAIETAHRAKSICSEIFRHGVLNSKCSTDPTLILRGALLPTQTKNMASITDTEKLSGLLKAIDGYEGEFVTRCALKLAPLVFVRPGELRHAEWSEIDFDKREWRIPAVKMKMRRLHIVPLSKQAIAVLKEIQPLTGHWKYVFPSVRSKDRAMSNNTINAALHRMGYTKEEVTAHGFRGTASTLLHENGFKSAIIEVQLAHMEQNKVKAAYNHAEYLAERTDMMQWWADFLDGVKHE